MNKRGLSDIITTVLIILIALAAVVLIWAFVKGFLMKSGEQINVNSFSESFDVPLSSASMDNESGMVYFSVKRIAGTETITGIVITLEDSNGKVVPITKNDGYDVLQSRVYSINYTELGLKEVVYISVAPIYSGKTGNIVKKVKIGEISTNKGSADNGGDDENDEGSEVVCGNNIIDSNEQCDGTNLNGNTCEMLGFDGGTLSCNSTCGLNKDMCMAIPREGLLLWYKFDNDSNVGESATKVYDWSGNGNNGTVIGNAVFNSLGKFDGAYEFDGDADYIELNDHPSLEITSNNLFVSAWIKAPADSKYRFIVNKENPANSYDGFSLYLNDAGFLRLEVLNSFPTYGGVSGTTNVKDNQWHFVAGSYNGTDIIVYVDGIKEGNASYSGGMSFVDGPMRIGGRVMFWGSGQGYFNGLIDEVLIFNRSLSAAEINSLFERSI